MSTTGPSRVDRASPVELSILIVTHRNPDLTRECLRSVFAETHGISFEVIVVDSASGDGTPEMVAAEFPQVRLHAFQENVGFARGNNIAAALASGTYLLLLNPDTVVHDRALVKLLAFGRAHPDAALCGGRTLRPDGALDPRSCGAVPTLWSAACFASGLSTAFRRSALFNPESLGRWQRDTVREVGVVTGCLVLVSRANWQALGGFDERFFMYGEDADLSIRAARRGKLLITPEATITHVMGASTSVSGGKMTQIMRARVTLMRKHWPPARRRLGEILLLGGVALRAVGAEVRRLFAREPSAAGWQVVWKRRAEWRAGYSHTH
jgi:GT2 family glycosyltransferase